MLNTFTFEDYRKEYSIQITMKISCILGEYLSLNIYMLLLNGPFHFLYQNKRNEIYLLIILYPRNWILSVLNMLKKRFKQWNS